VEDLFLRIDVEAGRLLLVKRAERREVRARAFQWQVAADDIHDVTGGANLFEGCGRNPGHAGSLPDAAARGEPELQPFPFLLLELLAAGGRRRRDQEKGEILLEVWTGEGFFKNARLHRLQVGEEFT